MKNFLILGLLAALLFSVSAGLSLWLNQSKKEAEGDKTGEKDKDKAGSKNPVKPEPKEPKEPPESHGGPKNGHATTPGPDSTAILSDREARLRLRAEQIDLVLRDLQVERQVVEKLLQQVNVELKTASTRSSELEALAAELERKRIDFSATERQNIAKMATMYDSMPPENAAPILKQMADTGRMDTAVKILAQMKDRQAARILAELGDPALAAQMLDKMRLLKPTPATGAVPAGGVPPAKGP